MDMDHRNPKTMLPIISKDMALEAAVGADAPRLRDPMNTTGRRASARTAWDAASAASLSGTRRSCHVGWFLCRSASTITVMY
jgi:hypothetical protein